MELQVMHTEEMSWVEEAEFPGNVDVKVLRHDESCGARTLMVRVPAGAVVPSHSHRGVVQLYVLEGTCCYECTELSAGAYVELPSHSDVPMVSSEDGVTMLIIYDPVAE